MRLRLILNPKGCHEPQKNLVSNEVTGRHLPLCIQSNLQRFVSVVPLTPHKSGLVKFNCHGVHISRCQDDKSAKHFVPVCMHGANFSQKPTFPNV
jgi:hypothetical protein